MVIGTGNTSIGVVFVEIERATNLVDTLSLINRFAIGINTNFNRVKGVGNGNTTRAVDSLSVENIVGMIIVILTGGLRGTFNGVVDDDRVSS